MNSRQAQLDAFNKLLDIMDDLREKCPWDKKQTLESLRPLTIEETYELADAIIENDLTEVKKELGDVLLHIVFYSKIGSEKGAFDIADVCNDIVAKLIHRHPHIYGNVEVKDENEVKENWEKLKLKEGKKSVFEGVPNALPSMVKAIRLQEKAKGVGFEWPSAHGAIEKVDEELQELKEAIKNKNANEIEKEFGDFIFSIINATRYYKVNSDNALEKTNQKFKSRFEFIEKRAKELEKPLHEMTLEEIDKIWDEAKTFEK
ncbi:MAG: nucleoside triphosphate pyrophosphohydrolase [Bacteroidia bacterium]